MQDDGLLPKKKKKKPTLDEIWKELKELERKHNEANKGIHVCPPCTLPHYPPRGNNTWLAPHYHGSGQPCWNNPCVWC